VNQTIGNTIKSFVRAKSKYLAQFLSPTKFAFNKKCHYIIVVKCLCSGQEVWDSNSTCTRLRPLLQKNKNKNKKIAFNNKVNQCAGKTPFEIVYQQPPKYTFDLESI